MTDDIERYRTNLHDELNGAALCAAWAAAESNPLRKDLFLAVANSSGGTATVGADIARAEPWHRGASPGNESLRPADEQVFPEATSAWWRVACAVTTEPFR
jgi:hypothetical protein